MSFTAKLELNQDQLDTLNDKGVLELNDGKVFLIAVRMDDDGQGNTQVNLEDSYIPLGATRIFIDGTRALLNPVVDSAGCVLDFPDTVVVDVVVLD